MGMSNGGHSGLHSEINVTPLVDVVLVLLIIFMVIIPVMMRGHDLDIPGESTAAAPAGSSPEQVVLAIDADDCPVVEPPRTPGLPGQCRVRVNGEPVALTDLARRVATIFGSREPDDHVLFLAAEDRLNYEGVMRVIDAARSDVPDLRIGLVMEAEPAP